ncbi:hypothetical protein Plec18167_007783 [Paecilomyces lecythidis]|uniref:PWI domain-containing protein n=1 Tax=Paecilomyces lecythidis TaxID=3004212 RepID=A0ABR3X0Q6_9EURO
MAASVDAKLLRQTKFPPEFSKKVDMTKVNIEVMKKWIAGKIIEILGNEDDVVIELCFNLLEGSRFPDIKSLQIQLTGFLDKDTPKFCKDLWNLCISAQENPQGVPKELLEAKKLELRQEKLDAERAAEEARRRKEQEQNREREIDNIRQRERATRGGRGPPPGGRGVAVRPAIESPGHGGSLIHMFRRLHDEDAAPLGRSRVHCLALRLHRGLHRCVDHAMGEETDPETGDEGVRSVTLVPQTGRMREGRADAVQMPVMIELDPLPAVFHLAHVLPGETEGEIDQLLPAAFRDHLRPETIVAGSVHLYQGHGPDPSSAHGLALEALVEGVAAGGDLRPTIPEPIEEMHALMLESAVDPVMIPV